MKHGIFFLALAFTMLVSALIYYKVASSPKTAVNKPVVVIIGDSNSDANSITDVRKWSEDYALAHTDDQIVVNLAIGGHAVEDFNTNDIFQGLRAISQSVTPGSRIFVVSLLGTNNAIMMEKLDTPDQFVRNYEILMTQVDSILHPQAIVIGSLPTAFPQQSNPVAYTPNFKAYKLIDQFNESLKKWTETKQHIGTAQLSFVSILPKASYDAANMSSYFIPDGIHLNRESQKIIFEKIDPVIQELVEKR